MERRILLLLFFIFLAVLGFSQAVPPKNTLVVEFCEKHKGKKVGKGECWDLAKEALDEAAADWSPPYGFGKEINPKKEEVLPGDIIQFENVRIQYPDKSGMGMAQHTAIIYKVLGKNHFQIAEQNSNNRRYVLFTEIDLNYLTKGKYSLYRPQ